MSSGGRTVDHPFGSGHRCRSAVQRDGRDREIELVPQPEAIGRMQAVFTQVVRDDGGIADEEIDRSTRALALDSIPKVRHLVVQFLASAGTGVLDTSAEIADALCLPTGTVPRALADLAAHEVVVRHSDDHVHRWGVTVAAGSAGGCLRFGPGLRARRRRSGNIDGPTTARTSGAGVSRPAPTSRDQIRYTRQ